MTPPSPPRGEFLADPCLPLTTAGGLSHVLGQQALTRTQSSQGFLDQLRWACADGTAAFKNAPGVAEKEPIFKPSPNGVSREQSPDMTQVSGHSWWH